MARPQVATWVGGLQVWNIVTDIEQVATDDR
jgi:hypothetical protein